MAREVIVGDFGELWTGTLADESSAALAKGDIVEVTAKGDSSKFGAVPVGGAYYAPVAVTLATGDKYKKFNQEKLTFVRSWNIELTRNSVDTTVLNDEQSTSVFGRPTLSGTVAGYLVTGDPQMDAAYKRFMDSYVIANDGVATKLAKDSSAFAFIGWTLKADANKNQLEFFYLPKADLGTISIGAEVGSLSEFSAPISLAADEQGRGITRYTVDLPAA